MSFIEKIKDKYRRYRWKKQFEASNTPLEFDQTTVPWIDKPNADIESFLKTFDMPENLGYDLKEALESWQKNGFVWLKQVIPHEWLDTLWNDVEEVIENNHKYNLKSLTYKFNDQKETSVKDVPKELLNKQGSRLIDFHHISVAAKKVISHPSIATFLKAMLDEQVVVYSNLIFKYGSQQHSHQDYPWTRSGIMSHLAGTWIPCEDIVEGSGPLYYYVGSHNIPKFNFGTGIHFDREKSYYDPEDYAKYLDNYCQKAGFEKVEFLPKKGDVLIWHSALVHGGSYLTKNVTRKSYVTHLTSERSYPKHKLAASREDTIVETINGVHIYHNPADLAEENILKAGESL